MRKRDCVIKWAPSNRVVAIIFRIVLVGFASTTFSISLKADEISTYAQQMENYRRQIREAAAADKDNAVLSNILANIEQQIRSFNQELENLNWQYKENEAACDADWECNWITRPSGIMTGQSRYLRTKKQLDDLIAQNRQSVNELQTRLVTENQTLQEYGIYDIEQLHNLVSEHESRFQCHDYLNQLAIFCTSPAILELNARCGGLPQTSIGWTPELIAFNENWCSKSYCTPSNWPKCE